MLLKFALVAFVFGSPAAYDSYTTPVPGSATIGPIELLNVASPVAAPWPGIGEPAGDHVAPSSVERLTRISVLDCESWYESHALVPLDVIHSRSAPALSTKMCWHPPGEVVPAGQRVTLTPSW